MRGSVRRRSRSRGYRELTVDLGRDTDGRRVRRFRTVRGTKAEAQRVLNGMLLEAEMGGKELSPRLGFHAALAEGAGVSPAPFSNLPLV